MGQPLIWPQVIVDTTIGVLSLVYPLLKGMKFSLPSAQRPPSHVPPVSQVGKYGDHSINTRSLEHVYYTLLHNTSKPTFGDPVLLIDITELPIARNIH